MSKAKQIRTDQELSKLEEEYNTWRRMIMLGDSKAMEEVRNLIVKMILEGNDNAKNIMFDWGTGNVFELDNATALKLGNQIQSISSRKDIDKSTRLSYNVTVIKRFKAAFDQLKTIQSSESKETIRKTLINLAKEFFNVANSSDAVLREMMAKGEIKSVGIRKTNVKVVTRQQAEEMANAIRVAMGLNSVGRLGSLKGKFEEYVAAAAKLKAMGVAANNIKEFENQLRKEINKYGGANKTTGTIESDIISLSRTIADELAKNKDFTLRDANGTYRFKTTESEQKMDALFSWDGGPAEGIPLSIKNYNLSSQHPISLVTKSPLSSFLFNLGNTDYTNHFLNIFAAHKSTPSSFRNMRVLAEESLAYSLLWSAMSGRGVGKKEGFADVFVVNDNSKKGDVKIYDIGKLVNNVINRSNALKVIDIDPTLSSISIMNNFETAGKSIGDNIQRRLTKLIANTRAIKMSVKLGTEAFKE
jgi:hypothetical protein